MAITNITPQWQGRGATTDETGVRTLRRAWLVEVDDPTDGEPDVIDAVVAVDATAALYAPHPDWPAAVCRSLSADPHTSRLQWMVRATYSSKPFAAQGDGGLAGGSAPTEPSAATSNSTPANERPPTITVTSKKVTVPLVEDAMTGAKHLNAAGDPFDPPAEVERSFHVITWKLFRTPEELNWGARAAFLDTVNDAAYTILGKTYPARTLRCTDYALDAVWETGSSGLTLMFALTIVAEEDPRTWKVKTLNTGRRVNVIDTGVVVEKRYAVDNLGQPVADPILLAANGEALAIDGVPNYIEADGYLLEDWTHLLA